MLRSSYPVEQQQNLSVQKSKPIIAWRLLNTQAVMELYFGSFKPDDKTEADRMLVCFSIPDVGIAFKAPFTGEELHTEYASLLTLLEFIELNQKIFTGKELKIYGTNPDMINQVNEKSACQYEFTELLRKVLEYKKKYNYKLGLIPSENNPSTNSLFD